MMMWVSKKIQLTYKFYFYCSFNHQKIKIKHIKIFCDCIQYVYDVVVAVVVRPLSLNFNFKFNSDLIVVIGYIALFFRDNGNVFTNFPHTHTHTTTITKLMFVSSWYDDDDDDYDDDDAKEIRKWLFSLYYYDLCCDAFYIYCKAITKTRGKMIHERAHAGR